MVNKRVTTITYKDADNEEACADPFASWTHDVFDADSCLPLLRGRLLYLIFSEGKVRPEDIGDLDVQVVELEVQPADLVEFGRFLISVHQVVEELPLFFFERRS